MNPALQPFLMVAADHHQHSPDRLAEISSRLTEFRGDMNRRFEEVNVRLERIERKLDSQNI